MFAGKPILFLLIYFGFCYPAYPDKSETEVVIVEGIGSSVQDASKDAAQKALIKVIGSLLDVQTTLEKTTVIQESARKESSHIRSDIREYSQGSIQNFELLNVGKDGDILTISAKVTVKKEVLVAAIKKDTDANLSIDGVGLSVQASSNDDQKINQAGILVDRVLKPIADYEFTHFAVSKPKKVDEQFKIKKTNFIRSLKNKYGDDFRSRNIYQVTVSSELNKEFIKQTKKTLTAISQEENILATLHFVFNPLLMSGSTDEAKDNILMSLIRLGKLTNDDVVLISSDGVNEAKNIQTNLDAINALNSKISFRIYIMKGVKPELSAKSIQVDSILNTPAGTKNTSKDIIINFLDDKSELVDSYNCGDQNDANSTCLAESIDFTGLESGASRDSFKVKSWRLLDAVQTNFLSSFYNSESPGFLIFFEKRLFNLYFYVPTTKLERFSNIELKIGG